MNRRDFLLKSLAVSGLAITQPWVYVKEMAKLGDAGYERLLDAYDVKAEAFTQYAGKKIIWNSLLASGQPDTDALYGMPYLLQRNRSSFGTTGWTDDTTVPESGVWYDNFATGMDGISSGYRNGTDWFFLDIETWVDCPGAGDIFGAQAARLQCADDYVTMYNELATRMPNAKFGIYMEPMFRDFNSSGWGQGYADFTTWQTANNEMASGGIYELVPALFPSVYATVARSSNRWNASLQQRYAIYNILEQRRLIREYGNAQPIYPFLHEYAVTGSVLLELDLFETMFRTCYSYGDGVVLWGGSGETWEDYVLKPHWIWLQGHLDAKRFWPKQP